MKRFAYWDICLDLHAMNDMGCDSAATEQAGHMVYSRSRTYNAECFRLESGKQCNRRGRCVIAKFKIVAEAQPGKRGGGIDTRREKIYTGRTILKPCRTGILIPGLSD